MPARSSESIVLRTYPLKEADLVVSFFTRDQGKLRGVAKRARRPKSPFGSGLERLSQVRMAYFQRENRELVNLDSCELIRSQFGVAADYQASAALDYLAEVTEQLLPPGEPNEKHFRLLLAVLDHAGSGAPGAVWRALTYFSVWAVRLAGLLPELEGCGNCGVVFDPAHRAWYNRFRGGLVCTNCRRELGLSGSWELDGEAREIAVEMMRKPVSQLTDRPWSQATAPALRRFLVHQIENHIERRLLTAPVLESPSY